MNYLNARMTRFLYAIYLFFILTAALSAQKQNSTYLLTALKDKKQQGDLNTTIINPEGWVKTVETNEIGQASFTPNKKGLYLINLEWIDNTKGSFKDKAFDNTIHKTVLSLIVE